MKHLQCLKLGFPLVLLVYFPSVLIVQQSSVPLKVALGLALSYVVGFVARKLIAL
jgi:hypothetical protein